MQPPPLPPDSRQHWVTFAEAQRRLSMSEGTLRRRIKAGRIEAAEYPRAEGDPRNVWWVLVDLPPASSADAVPIEDAQPPPILQEAPPAARSALLDALVSAEQQIISMHEESAAAYERIIRLERENAILQTDATHASAENESLRARLAAAEADLAAENRKSWWDKLRGR